MALSDSAPLISPFKLIARGRVTNWPAQKMLGFACVAFLAVICVLMAFSGRSEVANWYELAIVAGAIAIGSAGLSVYYWRVACWRHHVQTTLDPENKGGL